MGEGRYVTDYHCFIQWPGNAALLCQRLTAIELFFWGWSLVLLAFKNSGLFSFLSMYISACPSVF
jgi:hypothetical protein